MSPVHKVTNRGGFSMKMRFAQLTAAIAVAALLAGCATQQTGIDNTYPALGGAFEGTYSGPLTNTDGNPRCGPDRQVTWRVINGRVTIKRPQQQDAQPLIEADVATDGSFTGSKLVSSIRANTISTRSLSGRIEGQTIRAFFDGYAGNCKFAVVLQKVDESVPLVSQK
jgi:hypothetical protein